VRKAILAHSVRFTVAVVAIAMLLAAGGTLLAKWYVTRNTSPWFGRGNRLPKVPYRVVVGPVRMGQGIPGVVELGTSRARVLARIGPPLVERMTAQDAESRGFVDIEDVAGDFLQGVFAWVRYDGQEEVMSITFDLEGFRSRFSGDEMVVLDHLGSTYLLDRSISQRTAIRALSSRFPALRLRVQGADVVIEHMGTVLEFSADRQSLSAVVIMPLS
jgi:hypothetical protein